jgi:hypothetical protein
LFKIEEKKAAKANKNKKGTTTGPAPKLDETQPAKKINVDSIRQAIRKARR